MDQQAASASPVTRDTLATPALQEAPEQLDLKVRKVSVEIPGGKERAELLVRLDPLVHWVEPATRAVQAVTAGLDIQDTQAPQASLDSRVPQVHRAPDDALPSRSRCRTRPECCRMSMTSTSEA